MASANIECQVREKVGSRDARHLRRAGRIPASLQADGDNPHVNLHLPEDEFLAARRKHVHLFDLVLGSNSESAVIRELQWDALGDRINHVEFKRVVRGVETESEVELAFFGQVAAGNLNHSVTHITIKCLPSIIPDAIEVNVTGMEPGTHIMAGDLTMPEGVSLAVPADLEVAVVAAPKAEVEETSEDVDGEEGAADPAE